MLKLVTNSGKKGTAVYVKNSMLLVKKRGMLYVGKLKIWFGRVEQIAEHSTE